MLFETRINFSLCSSLQNYSSEKQLLFLSAIERTINLRRPPLMPISFKISTAKGPSEPVKSAEDMAAVQQDPE